MTTVKPIVFVAGATGAVGQVLLPCAERRGLEVRPHVRPASADRLSHPGKVVLELADPKLADALRGCTTVVQLIGTMKKRFAAGDTYETSDIGTTRQLVWAAKQAGVKHFILLSSVGAGSPVGAYLKAKAQAEALVRESGIPFTLFRPSAFEDRAGQRLPGARALTKLFGLTKYQPIRLEELASALVHVAAKGAPTGVALEGRSLWAVVEEAGRA
ncbi:MAG: NAD(P)H-binding protein [Myxococcales bacterium]|nr:NAD(P)H-binding protein [Myxococcales bacterium]